jgi:hypothetical protein
MKSVLAIWIFTLAVTPMAQLVGSSRASAQSADVTYHLGIRGDGLRSAGDYLRMNARIMLGPERRLPNGVSWRMQADEATRIAFPRLTWMPDRQRLATANRLLEEAHGIEWLTALDLERSRDDLNATYVALTGMPITTSSEPILQQWEVSLNYVGSRLMSVHTSGVENSGGSHPPTYLRGLTFDLQEQTIVELSPCPSRTPRGPAGPFRFGQLLELCDPARYSAFIAAVRDIDLRRGRRSMGSPGTDTWRNCRDWPESPVFREDQEYVDYLTFRGLAVHAAGNDCSVMTTASNPVIVPYPDISAFMQPGPWRDELLSLK